ncbi:MAG: hypothetical protein ACRDCA_12660 [Serratia sp. (in: enterobacteria)]|uniref:hypothetical protein n=1 Tax=Serratia sp. (in: enterobacteria) TaxID=616 RepID=UPI003F3F738C
MMKPTSLKPGQRVLIQSCYEDGETFKGTFIERVPRHYCRAAYSVIQVDEFAGIHGSNDLGETNYSDYDVSRRVTLIK